MSWILQLFTGGSWLAWLINAVLIVEMSLLSHNWARQFVGVYHSGPFGEAALAAAMGVLGFFCLNGIFEGFERGNMLGLVAGCLGMFLIAKGFLLLFAPHLLAFIPF